MDGAYAAAWCPPPGSRPRPRLPLPRCPFPAALATGGLLALHGSSRAWGPVPSGSGRSHTNHDGAGSRGKANRSTKGQFPPRGRKICGLGRRIGKHTCGRPGEHAYGLERHRPKARRARGGDKVPAVTRPLLGALRRFLPSSLTSTRDSEWTMPSGRWEIGGLEGGRAGLSHSGSGVRCRGWNHGRSRRGRHPGCFRGLKAGLTSGRRAGNMCPRVCHTPACK